MGSELGLKVAISGKGGVGKSTLAAALSILLAKRGTRVLAIDADPDSNLGSALGLSPEQQLKIVPIAQQKALIEERTGAKVKQYGQMFKINPSVSDIAEICGLTFDNITLLVLGAIESGGSGCACPENVLIKALVTDLILNRDETLIMDMEAGVEHLGRATVKGVDILLIVVEPGQRSIESAQRICKMAHEIGMPKIALVANKVALASDEEFIRASLKDQKLIATIPNSNSLRGSDRIGKSVLDNADPQLIACFESILVSLLKIKEENNRA